MAPVQQPRELATAAESSGLQGTRAQALQRLQVGVGGLAAMVLVVGLASTIMQQARQSSDPAAPTAAAEQEKKAGDPLVDIGVQPELPNEEVTVPDLPVEQIVPEEQALPRRQGEDGMSQSQQQR
ncbi:hypothetical protein [Croceicoccus mobilis]|uniref:Uncharacterized protein n=1 Tax=Croceicoccus mobilis TaxID=1703339 RepID=A0A917DQ62_9SPHN|nr:hypothetical protein [Croceicoccus mobilis]GGD55873.1 hypothetical protein GCM10010990_01310 [Croceicoccus mobilis]